jgi:hypothetical protein
MWKMTKSDEKRLDTFQNSCLRKILKMRWQDKISNKELHTRKKTENISNIICRIRWNWIGHVLRMESTKHCAVALTWRPEGKRK